MVKCKNCGLEWPEEILGPECPECGTYKGKRKPPVICEFGGKECDNCGECLSVICGYDY